MTRLIVFGCVCLLPIASIAAEPMIGDKVFVKPNAQASIDDQIVDVKTISSPATVGKLDGDRVFVGKAWLHKTSVMTADEALEFYDNQIALDGTKAATWIERGLVRLQKDTAEDLDKAFEDFDQAVRLEPNSAKAYCGRGSVLTAKDELEKADTDFTEAIRIDPTDGAGFRDRGWCRALKNDLAAALTDANEAVRLNPDDAKAYSHRGSILRMKGKDADLDSALKDHDQAINLDPNNAYFYFRRGYALREAMKYGSAIGDYNRAIQTDPKNLAYRVHRAHASLVIRRFDDVISDCDEILKTDENHVLAYAYRGYALYEKRVWTACVKDFDKAIALDANNAEYYDYRTRASLLSKNMDRAINDCTAAITFKTKQVDPRAELKHSANDELNSLLNKPFQGISSPYRLSDLYGLRGDAWRSKGKLDAAIKDYTEAIRLDPDDDRSLRIRSMLFEKTGDIENLVKDYNQLLKRKPNDCKVLNNLAWIEATCSNERIRDAKLALLHASKACQMADWCNYQYFDTLAAACAAGGDFANAVKWADKVHQKASGKFKRDVGKRLDLYRANTSCVLVDWSESQRKAAINGSKLAAHVMQAYLVPPLTVNVKVGFASGNDADGIPKHPRNIDDLLEGAMLLQSYGDADTALSAFTQVIESYPDFSDAYAVRGDLFQQKGEVEKAIKDYREAIRHDPNHSRAYRADAWLLATCTDDWLRDGRLAIEYATKACGLTNWIQPDALDALAAAHAEVGEFRSAIHWATKSFEMAPTSARFDRIALYSGQNSYREPSDKGTSDIVPADNSTPSRWRDAVRPLSSRPRETSSNTADPDGPFKELADKIKSDPQNAHLYASRGDVLYAIGDFSNAIRDYDEAIKLDPKNATYRVHKSRTRARTNDLTGALRDCEKAIRIEPTNALAYACRGFVRYEMREHDEALNDFGWAISLDPQNSKYYVHRGCLLKEVRDYEGALNDFTEAIRLQPKNPAYYQYRASVFEQQGEPVRAIADYTEAIKLDPNGITCYVSRGSAYHAQHEYENAIQDFNAAVRLNSKQGVTQFESGAAAQSKFDELDPVSEPNEFAHFPKNDASIFILRAAAWLAIDNNEYAIKDCTEAIRLAPEQRLAYVYRATARSQMGRRVASVDDDKRALKLCPNDLHLLNKVAWAQAASSDNRLRDGKSAVANATKVCELSDWKNCVFLETLAAAYAEAGDFQTAIKWAERALEMAPGSSKRFVGEQLELYRMNKPYRESGE